MERSNAELKMDNVPAPYYIEYRVTEVDQFEASAVFGALRNQQRNRARLLRVVVRVGDYKQDSFYGSGEGAIDLVPSDNDVYAIRHRIWLATDRAYKAASEALSAKQAALKQLKVDEPVDDFAKATPVEAVEPLARFSSTDFTPWIHLLEEASALYRSDKELENFERCAAFHCRESLLPELRGHSCPLRSHALRRLHRGINPSCGRHVAAVVARRPGKRP